MKVISFPLWGRNPKYLTGAIRNAELAATVYPGWRCRFYCAASTPADAVSRLASLPHVDVVRRDEAGDWTAMFWRLHAAADAGVEAAIFRDADSRVGGRERAAVDAWLASGRAVHVMRDHPLHDVPILAGMWGVRGGVLTDVEALIARWPHRDDIQVDQDFLRVMIVPRIRGEWLEHDEYFARRPFPTRRRGREFVGQPFDEHDRPLIEGPTALEQRLRQTARAVLEQVGLRQPRRVRM